MAWETGLFDWLDDYHDKHGAYPEDHFLSWVYHHPRVAVATIFAVISGLPCVAGFVVGALVF